jgi:hypothetical protein
VIAVLVSCAAKPSSPIVVPVPSFTPSSQATSAPARIVGALPTGCGAIGSAEEISDAIGRTLSGTPRLVTGAADGKIGRTARIDCYYGLDANQETKDAPVAVGLASYTDASAAGRRVQTTVEDERKAGATVREITVGADKGTLLIGKKIVTLVATHQATTVVVIAQIDVVTAEQAPSSLGKIADRALSPR